MTSRPYRLLIKNIQILVFAAAAVFASVWLARATVADNEVQDDLKVNRFNLTDKSPEVHMEYAVLDNNQELGKIVGAFKRNKYFASNDVIYIKLKATAASPGDRFSIYTDLGKIDNAQKVQIKGTIQITRVLPQAIEARIMDSHIDIAIGDKIGPDLPARFAIDPKQPATDIRGKVLDSATRLSLIGPYDFVYINKGESDGLRLNDKLWVVRTGDGKESLTEGLPEVDFSEIVVVQMASKASLAYVLAGADTFSKNAPFKAAIPEVRYLDTVTDAPKKSPAAK